MYSLLTKRYSQDGALTFWIITELLCLLGPLAMEKIHHMNVPWPNYQAALDDRQINSVAEQFLNGYKWTLFTELFVKNKWNHNDNKIKKHSVYINSNTMLTPFSRVKGSAPNCQRSNPLSRSQDSALWRGSRVHSCPLPLETGDSASCVSHVLLASISILPEFLPKCKPQACPGWA